MSKNQNKMVTIVCCYNDSGQYQKFCTSLENQNVAYELVGIDNRTQRFSSCSSALNVALSSVNTEYVIYSHQDIELPEADMLERFLAYLGQTGKNDIVGVAGAVEEATAKPETVEHNEDRDGTCVLSRVRHGGELACAGELEFHGLVECDTVDECFFGGRTETFRTEPFDEELCDNWHLYAVERCLRARVRGGKVWVCDVPLIHHSGGNINHSYNEGFRRIAAHYAKLPDGDSGRKVRERIKVIRTVCGSARTDWLHRNLFYWKRELLFRLHRL